MYLTSYAHDYRENVHIDASSCEDLSICLQKRERDREGSDELLLLTETNLHMLHDRLNNYRARLIGEKNTIF